MRSGLTSDNHSRLAHTLSDMMIDIIKEDESLGGSVVAGRLKKLRDIIWPEGERVNVEAERRVFRDARESLSDTQLTHLYEAYARLGHIYEIAGQAARQHFFQKQRDIPGGVNEFLQDEHNADLAVEKLNQPVFEVVMTMHPTNTHSLESMKAQRAMFKALESGDETTIRNTMQALLHTTVLHQQHGADANFTVRDETAVVLNFLDNLYEDTPAIYREYDKAFTKKFNDGYKPEDLKLNLRLGSWGSAGDKDGNNNVTAEATLEAIAMHTTAIVGRYLEDMERINDPALTSWKERLTEANHRLEQEVLPRVGELRERSNMVRAGEDSVTGEELNRQFDELSRLLADIRQPLEAKKFESDLAQAYAQSHDTETLEMLRKIRIFGFNFSKIEYRETAEEYARVASILIDGYDRLDSAGRAAKLTEVLTGEGNQAEALLKLNKERIVRDGATEAYSKDSALPIAYHTMKRMELARDFPDMIQDNVLAECGRVEAGPHNPSTVAAQGVANILEAQLVQRMVGEKDGKRVKLGIIPLFEEPDTMMNIDVIMREAYENKAYKTHLEQMADRHHGKPTQQVQIAHSDNARRSGLLAARAYIHEAHKKMRKLNEEKGIGTEFFEGGSVSDAYRNGVRAVSASVNAFDLHDFIKFTFQGGDLMNYFSAPSSSVRLMVRNITHAAERFEKKDGEWIVRKRRADRPDTLTPVVENRRPNPILDEIAIDALKHTLADYQRDDFRRDTMGVLLAFLDYKGETSAGVRGSRAAARGNTTTFAKVEGVYVGRVRPIDNYEDLEPVDIENVRTISFSEAWQHAGIVPSWLGSKNLGQHLLEECKKKLHQIAGRLQLSTHEEEFIKYFGNLSENGAEISPKQIKMFYEKSPTFRDAQDRSAFAIAMTDPESLRWLQKRLEYVENCGARPEMVAAGKAYLAHIHETYGKAADLAYAALTGEKIKGEVRQSMTGALARLSDDIKRKANYRDFLLYAKLHGTDDHQRGVLHNAGDTVVHGRFLAADDPTYGQARVSERAVLAV